MSISYSFIPLWDDLNKSAKEKMMNDREMKGLNARPEWFKKHSRVIGAYTIRPFHVDYIHVKLLEFRCFCF